jgi:hypothetical protein
MVTSEEINAKGRKALYFCLENVKESFQSLAHTIQDSLSEELLEQSEAKKFCLFRTFFIQQSANVFGLNLIRDDTIALFTNDLKKDNFDDLLLYFASLEKKFVEELKLIRTELKTIGKKRTETLKRKAEELSSDEIKENQISESVSRLSLIGGSPEMKEKERKIYMQRDAFVILLKSIMQSLVDNYFLLTEMDVEMRTDVLNRSDDFVRKTFSMSTSININHLSCFLKARQPGSRSYTSILSYYRACCLVDQESLVLKYNTSRQLFETEQDEIDADKFLEIDSVFMREMSCILEEAETFRREDLTDVQVTLISKQQLYGELEKVNADEIEWQKTFDSKYFGLLSHVEHSFNMEKLSLNNSYQQLLKEYEIQASLFLTKLEKLEIDKENAHKIFADEQLAEQRLLEESFEAQEVLIAQQAEDEKAEIIRIKELAVAKVVEELEIVRLEFVELKRQEAAAASAAKTQELTARLLLLETEHKTKLAAEADELEGLNQDLVSKNHVFSSTKQEQAEAAERLAERNIEIHERHEKFLEMMENLRKDVQGDGILDHLSQQYLQNEISQSLNTRMLEEIENCAKKLSEKQNDFNEISDRNKCELDKRLELLRNASPNIVLRDSAVESSFEGLDCLVKSTASVESVGCMKWFVPIYYISISIYLIFYF